MTDDAGFAPLPEGATVDPREPDVGQRAGSEAIAAARAESQEVLTDAMRQAAALRAEAAGYRYAANVSAALQGMVANDLGPVVGKVDVGFGAQPGQ